MQPLTNISSTAVPSVVERYGTSEQLLQRFRPELQHGWCMKFRSRMFTGDAPMLREVADGFGDGTAMAWVSKQLQDLSEFSGAQQKLSPQQVLQLCGLILSEYGHYKLTELMVFFHDYKTGRFGTFYGAVDPLTIMKSLREFWKVQGEEMTKYHQIQHEREMEVREREVERKSELLMRQLGERVMSGDQDALRLLCKIEDYAKVNKS